MNELRSWFITGTDTGVGKTLVSCALIAALARTGRHVIGMKPVASGCENSAQGLRSEDALAMFAASNVAAHYDDINPYAFAPATAPHLAAAAMGVEIKIDRIQRHYSRLAAQADAIVVEGVGGWLVPINRNQTMADVVRALDLAVILVVDVRLGSLNHALLTAQAVAASGCRLHAWVANQVGANSPEGYLEALRERLDLPLLATIPHASSLQAATSCIDLTALPKSS